MANVPAAAKMQSESGRGTVRGDLLRIGVFIDIDDLDACGLTPLLEAVLLKKCEDDVWDAVDAVAQLFGHPETLQPPLAARANSKVFYFHMDEQANLQVLWKKTG
ncbi:MAG: hypothetical protein MMC33_002488 [Icmadophila ericetorum]|nr:hypothetical protein [Icmadophila ericetorum]